MFLRSLSPAQSAEEEAQELYFAGEETSASQDDSDNSVSESLDDCDYSVAEISRSFRSQRELCEQLNINHMIQRIFLITLDNSECSCCPAAVDVACLAKACFGPQGDGMLVFSG